MQRAARVARPVSAPGRARRVRPRRGADRDRRRGGARVARRPAARSSSALGPAPQPALGRARLRLLRRLCDVELPRRTPLLLTREGVGVSEGEPWQAGTARPGGGSRRASPTASTPTRRGRSSTSTARSCCAATTTSPRWSAAGRTAAHMCADHVEAGGLSSRPGAGCGRSGRGNRAMPLPDPGLAADSPRSRSNERDAKPVLWHIPVSHYSEKVRWALTHKGVEHERSAPLPGPHMAVALWLTRGGDKTFPVLHLDGRSDRRLDRDHRGARAALARAAAVSRRTRTSGAGRSSSRTSSTSSSARHPAARPGTS